MLAPRSSLVALVSSLVLFGCGGGSSSSDGAGGAAGGGAGASAGGGGAGVAGSGGAASTSRLNPDALAELVANGAEEFEGQAVVMEERGEGDETTFVFDPASGPVCVRGAPFQVHIRDKGSEDLIIFLQGGGACWTGFPFCSEDPDPVLLPLAFMNDDDPNNFAKDWNVLYLPYCDGSVFSGDNQLEDADGTRYHRGRRNVAAAFDVAKANLPTPKRIFLAGLSAGGYGTVSVTGLARIAYPDADLFVFNDSGPGIQNLNDTANIQTRIDEWKFDTVIPDSCAECDGGRGQLSEFVGWMLENDPSLRVGTLSYYRDPVIGDTFLQLPGNQYKDVLVAETDKIHQRFPDRYRRFFVSDNAHVVSLAYPNIEVDGVTIAQWAEALVTGGDAWRDLLAPDP